MPFGVDADGEVSCAGGRRQDEAPGWQRAFEQKSRYNISEMLRQRDSTLKLLKRVESLLDGDGCHLARTVKREM